MFNELALNIEEHLGKGSNFAIAQVVDRIAPSSGKIGDKALILETGEMIGWVGGGCVRGIVIKEALDVIKSRRFRRIRISPEGGTVETPSYKEYVMSCQSKGTVEILIEPMISQPEIIIVGKSNIGRKLAALAAAADFRVTILADEVDSQMFPRAHRVYDKVDFSPFRNLANAYIIVTTQGDNDDVSVKRALETRASYVGFVASAAKAADIRAHLAREGMSEGEIARLRSPVGLDINAKLASEVAISILAEVIAEFRNSREGAPSPGGGQQTGSVRSEGSAAGDAFAEEYYINPVCQVPVSRKNPKHIIEYKGELVYFCCDGCKVTFEKDPGQFIK
jgi:xanthine dehydrogenase accessory factor